MNQPLEPFTEPLALPEDLAKQDGPIVGVDWDSKSGVHTNMACTEPWDVSTLPAFWHPYPAYKIGKKS